ncbi:MAG: hydroxymethylbutenyl pyrophosphate reductase [Deltaproteobacteria bacterium SG8_13]|nr:MAG: hydroxymethylbutenyl pyrophosphate reductase [Deltaproteobacteria bacterium SG8_13]
MKILIAKTAGFCMGVRRAVEMVMVSPDEKRQPVYTFGPLIHNPQVLSLLEEKGIRALTEIPEHGSGTVLIRAHGVPPEIKSRLKTAGFEVIDATCPRVIKVQTIIRKHAKKGFAAIILGDRDHPEVTGLLGYAGEKGVVVGSLEELEALPAFDQAIIVAQTTQNTQLFDSVKRWAVDKHPHYKIFDTICDSTERRQAEVQRLAGEVDAVVVVGGLHSGNTRRLTEIAAESGKPAYHIETEDDLDQIELKEISANRLIGITAGASTPNWVIKRVYRALEAMRFKKARGWHRLLFTLQRTLLLTNIYVSIGAGCLCFACSKLLGIEKDIYVIISMLYVQSMHTLNHLTGGQSDRFNDPGRALFYDKHQTALTALAVISGAAGLMLAYTTGPVPFLVLLVMSLLGLTYNLRIIPGFLLADRYRRLRDIPGSKTFLIALAWGTVTTLFPYLSVTGTLQIGTVLVFLWATGLVFVRTAFFDTLDMQGDRIVGKETIPILLGEKPTLRLLKRVLLAVLAGMLLSTLLGLVGSVGYALTVCPMFLAGILLAYEKDVMIPGIRLEFLLESHFLVAGAAALLWTVTG